MAAADPPRRRLIRRSLRRRRHWSFPHACQERPSRRGALRGTRLGAAYAPCVGALRRPRLEEGGRRVTGSGGLTPAIRGGHSLAGERHIGRAGSRRIALERAARGSAWERRGSDGNSATGFGPPVSATHRPPVTAIAFGLPVTATQTHSRHRHVGHRAAWSNFCACCDAGCAVLACPSVAGDAGCTVRGLACLVHRRCSLWIGPTVKYWLGGPGLRPRHPWQVA